MSFLVGLYVAIIAFSVTLCIKYLTGFKLAAVYARILSASSTRYIAKEVTRDRSNLAKAASNAPHTLHAQDSFL